MKTTIFCSHNQQSALWTTTDVARFIGCSERQIYVLRKTGLPCVHVGGMVRFDPQQIKRWLDAGDDSAEARALQLSNMAAHGDEDKTECAATDLAKEFPTRA